MGDLLCSHFHIFWSYFQITVIFHLHDYYSYSYMPWMDSVQHLFSLSSFILYNSFQHFLILLLYLSDSYKLSSLCSFLLIYMELFCTWGTGFLWYTKGSSWAQTLWTAFVWIGQYYTHSIPWVFKQLVDLRTQNIQATSLAPQGDWHSFKSLITSNSNSLNRGHLISSFLVHIEKVKLLNLEQ